MSTDLVLESIPPCLNSGLVLWAVKLNYEERLAMAIRDCEVGVSPKTERVEFICNATVLDSTDISHADLDEHATAFPFIDDAEALIGQFLV